MKMTTSSERSFPLTSKVYYLKEMGLINDVVVVIQDKSSGFRGIYLRGNSLLSMEELPLCSEQQDESLAFLKVYEWVEMGYFQLAGRT